MPEQTSYPLTLTVTPGPQLQLKLLYLEGRFDPKAVADLLSELCGLLSEAPRLEAQRVSRLLQWLPQASRGRARQVLRRRQRPDPGSGALPASELERTIASVWQELFQVDRVGIDVNFFDLGGHSLLLMRAHKRCARCSTAISRSWRYCSARRSALWLRASPARRLRPTPDARRRDGRAGVGRRPTGRPSRPVVRREAAPDGIAVIGMTGRFPGAPDLDTFWRNLQDGVDSVRRFAEDELDPAGPDETRPVPTRVT